MLWSRAREEGISEKPASATRGNAVKLLYLAQAEMRARERESGETHTDAISIDDVCGFCF
jgi:hypothetical protein